MALEGEARSDPAGRFGKYEIIARIGQGAMGEVYKARDTVLDRFVAIKTMSAAVLGNDELSQRFLREAQSAARLNHPNVVTLHEFGEEDGRLFMAMELLEGEDLKGLLKRGGLATLEDKLAIMEQILDGVAYAHSLGVVHRDLKPANIHVQANGRVKVMDFGLARLGESEMTRAGTIMGTPNYMSPEQVRGERTGPSSDVFALGAVFYEVIGGRRAFEAESMHAVLYKVTSADPLPLAECFPEGPRILELFIAKALAKEVELRYRDGGEMREALELCRRVMDGSLEEEAAVAGLRQFATVIEAPQAGDATLAQLEATATRITPTLAAPRRTASGLSGSMPAVRSSTGSLPSLRRPTRTGSNPGATLAAPRAVAPAASAVAAVAPARTGLYVGAGLLALLIVAASAVLLLRRPEPKASAPETRPTTTLASAPVSATEPSAQPASRPREVVAAPTPTEPSRVAEAPTRPSAREPVSKQILPPVTVALPPPTTSLASAPPRALEPLPTVAPAPVVASAPPTPVPNPTVNDEAAVRQLVVSFKRAIEEKDLALYKKLRPGLTAEDERRLRDAFNNVTSQQVDFSVDAIAFDGDKATVHVTRSGRVSGQTVPAVRQVLHLVRSDAGWVIAAIGQ